MVVEVHSVGAGARRRTADASIRTYTKRMVGPCVHGMLLTITIIETSMGLHTMFLQEENSPSLPNPNVRTTRSSRLPNETNFSLLLM